ncbi:YjcZ family sporulation protein [Metabacillus litoralis]
MPYTYEAPAYGYCAPTYRPNTFALIVVLFILLIIIGATIYGNKC